MSQPKYDEDYVRQLTSAADVTAAPDKETFRRRTQTDLNAGYRAEVDEAERRLFDPSYIRRLAPQGRAK